MTNAEGRGCAPSVGCRREGGGVVGGRVGLETVGVRAPNAAGGRVRSFVSPEPRPRELGRGCPRRPSFPGPAGGGGGGGRGLDAGVHLPLLVPSFPRRPRAGLPAEPGRGSG